MQINSGNLDLDSFLKGGYEKLTTFYGLPTSGKTCLSLMAVLEQIKENKVFFLDVKNDFNLVRLEQINGSKIDDYLNNLFVLQIKSFADQQKKINSLSKLIEKKEFSLIVIDGFNFYYRTLVNSKPDLAKGMLNSQLKILKEISKKTTVIITNDVFESFDTGDIKMIGGNIIHWWSDFVIKLEAGGNMPNRLRIIEPKKKSRFSFNIVEKGIEKT